MVRVFIFLRYLEIIGDGRFRAGPVGLESERDQPPERESEIATTFRRTPFQNGALVESSGRWRRPTSTPSYPGHQRNDFGVRLRVNQSQSRVGGSTIGAPVGRGLFPCRAGRHLSKVPCRDSFVKPKFLK